MTAEPIRSLKRLVLLRLSLSILKGKVVLIKVAREGTSHLTESMKAEIRQVSNHAMLWFVLFTVLL